MLRGDGLLVTAVDRTTLAVAEKARAAGKRFAAVAVDPDHALLRQLADLVDDGKLRIHVAEHFPFERAADAHRRLEDVRVSGTIVLTVGKR